MLIHAPPLLQVLHAGGQLTQDEGEHGADERQVGLLDLPTHSDLKTMHTQQMTTCKRNASRCNSNANRGARVLERRHLHCKDLSGGWLHDSHGHTVPHQEALQPGDEVTPGAQPSRQNHVIMNTTQ
jgi:hypothetical protein